MNTDGTENKQDTSGANQDTSGGNQGTSEAKTYTEAEVLKIKSDALSAAGRDAKANEARESTLKAREEAVALRDKERDEEAFEKARGNPEAISALQREREAKVESKRLADERAAIERDKLEVQIEKDAITAARREQGIVVLAEKYKVDAAVLKDLDLDLEHTEKVAQTMTPLSPEARAKLNPTTPANQPKKLRESGVTIGSGGNLTGLSPKDTLKEIDKQLRPT